MTENRSFDAWLFNQLCFPDLPEPELDAKSPPGIAPFERLRRSWTNDPARSTLETAGVVETDFTFFYIIQTGRAGISARFALATAAYFLVYLYMGPIVVHQELIATQKLLNR
jgi:hypothetical protein